MQNRQKWNAKKQPKKLLIFAEKNVYCKSINKNVKKRAVHERASFNYLLFTIIVDYSFKNRLKVWPNETTRSALVALALNSCH